VISLTSNDLEMSFREDRANAINPRYNPRSLNDPDVWPTLLATADDE